MKKILLILLCLPLLFSCGENKEEKKWEKELKEMYLKVDEKDFNYSEINDPCVFLDTLCNVLNDIVNRWNGEGRYKRMIEKSVKEKDPIIPLYYYKIYDKRRSALQIEITRWSKEDFKDCETSDRNRRLLLSADSLFNN